MQQCCSSAAPTPTPTERHESLHWLPSWTHLSASRPADICRFDLRRTAGQVKQGLSVSLRFLVRPSAQVRRSERRCCQSTFAAWIKTDDERIGRPNRLPTVRRQLILSLVRPYVASRWGCGEGDLGSTRKLQLLLYLELARICCSDGY